MMYFVYTNRWLKVIAVGVFLIPMLSTGQTLRIPAEKKRLMHNESPDDAYLPNAFNNKKTSPAYRYESGKQRSIGSSIITVQVNVDSAGQNILFDAGNESSIAVSPVNPNQIVIGWRQFDNISSNFRQAGYSYSADAGQTWTFRYIQQGIYRSDPVLDNNKDGKFYFNSLGNGFNCRTFSSTNGGATWNTGAAAHGGDKQWIAVDRTNGVGSGFIYSAWNPSYSTCDTLSFTRSINGNLSYTACTAIDGDPFWGTMTVGNAGELYVSGTNLFTNDVVVAKSLNAQVAAAIVTWELPAYVFMDGYLNVQLPINPVGLLGQVNIDVDRSFGPGRDNVYVLCSVSRLSNSDLGDVMFSRSTDGGVTWSAPVRVNDDVDEAGINIQWFGTMSVAPNGRIDAVWLDTRDDLSGTDSSALYYSYSYDQGNTWSVNEKLSASFNPHVGYPNQNKMGDYFDMHSDDTGAHLAWANTLNGEQDVYYSRIVPGIAAGLENASASTLFSVFPNPSNHSFTIQCNMQNAELKIVDVVGRIVYQQILTSPNQQITHSFAPGIYFVKVRDEEMVLTKKLVVE
jgi:hypothetical protein